MGLATPPSSVPPGRHDRPAAAPTAALRLVPRTVTAAEATANMDDTPRRRRIHLPGLLRSGLGLAAVASLAVTLVVVFGLGGWSYYWTPQDVRAYTDLHPLLRPSGAVGRSLGVAGLSLMLVMHLYSFRKRMPALRWMGPVTFWLEFHIFCGLLGPVLVTLHTSFKFNGLISVAYWSMVVVVASGFVGRYLYVRIPRSIRGHELGRAELEEQAAELRRQRTDLDLPADMEARIAAFEDASVPRSEDDTTWLGLLFGEPRMRLRLLSLGRTLRRTVEDRDLVSRQLALLAQRDLLLRRIIYLRKTKKLFDLWRVYHKPLAVLMAIIVALHVGIVWYFGYAFGVR